MSIRLPLRRKMILYLIPAALLVFGGAIGYITLKERARTIERTQKIADVTAQKYANKIQIESLAAKSGEIDHPIPEQLDYGYRMKLTKLTGAN